ncbi:MAG: glycosyltransferase family 2 protein [Kiritimatiellia bacterium]|nr:glycosyltransferase family 2 protein [Kiritimatiellia bacterium]
MELSVVIPFYNEEDSAPALLAELRTVLDGQHIAYEVIAVNDGSRDSTEAVLAGLAAGWPQLRCYSFVKNQGQSAGLMFGFLRARGQIIVTIDGDGQNDPADIREMVKHLGEGWDMVIGKRVKRQDSGLRKRMSQLANFVRGCLLHDKITDSGCALKVFRRNVVESFIPICTLYSFIPVLAMTAGYKVDIVPVNHRPRIAGKSHYGLRIMLWRPLLDLLGVLWFIHRRYAAVSKIAYTGLEKENV